MNFLAHFYLARSNDDWIVGNFLGDFLRGKEIAQMPDAIRYGIFLHRKIDYFTDNHRVFMRGTRRLHHTHHKYAPVVLDVLYDYFLIKNWNSYLPDMDLESFIAKVYAILLHNSKFYPPDLQTLLSNRIHEDWLSLGATPAGLTRIFDGLKKKVRYPDMLSGAVDNMLRHERQFDEEFNIFFPELIAAFTLWTER